MSMASLNLPSMHKRLMRPSLVLDLKKAFSVRGLFNGGSEENVRVRLKNSRGKDLEIFRCKNVIAEY